MSEGVAAARPHRALVLGWLGSTPRHLRPVARHLEARGAEVISIVPAALRAMATPGGWAREGARIARELSRLHHEDPRPWVLVSFSNAGFWSATAMLSRLDPSTRDAHVGTVLDSAPGFPPHVTLAYTARYASRAMMPGLLGALGLRPAHTHPLFTPPVALALSAWHLVAPRAVRFMEGSLAAMRDAHHGRAILALHGDADVLVEPAYVEAFCDAARADGLDVERHLFAGATHVRAMVSHRHAYLRALDAFVDRVLARVG